MSERTDSREPEGEYAALHHVGRRVAAALPLEPGDLAVIEPPTGLPGWKSNLRVAELAVDSVALASAAMALLARDRGALGARGTTHIDPARVEASFGSHHVLRINGAAPAVWAPLSGFWQTADGWVRTHGNYPHHARRLRNLLGLPADAGKSMVGAAIRERSKFELEESAAQEGALALAVRSPEEWRAHPQFLHLEKSPIVGFRSQPGPEPRRLRSNDGRLPLSGVRVLDLTRVIAGPVATRDLAFAGAEVLRIDSPELPEPEWQHFDTGQGKRSTPLNLGDRSDLDTLQRLLEGADVVVHGYRPSALAEFGLDSETLHSKHPGLIVAQLSAWGLDGPWGRRRGFDSLVQAASGIAVLESKDGGATPGALPVQALDHATGHFLAAAIATALRRQRADGGSFDITISLARIALQLLAAGPAAQCESDGMDSALPVAVVPVATSGDPISVECAPPTLSFPGAPEEYPAPLHPWGSDPAAWVDRDTVTTG